MGYVLFFYHCSRFPSLPSWAQVWHVESSWDTCVHQFVFTLPPVEEMKVEVKDNSLEAVMKTVNFIIQINHQPDATIFQFIIKTFLYSSTCYRRFAAHHQELYICFPICLHGVDEENLVFFLPDLPLDTIMSQFCPPSFLRLYHWHQTGVLCPNFREISYQHSLYVVHYLSTIILTYTWS
jgi:hypothetical protein